MCRVGRGLPGGVRVSHIMPLAASTSATWTCAATCCEPGPPARDGAQIRRRGFKSLGAALSGESCNVSMYPSMLHPAMPPQASAPEGGGRCYGQPESGSSEEEGGPSALEECRLGGGRRRLLGAGAPAVRMRGNWCAHAAACSHQALRGPCLHRRILQGLAPAAPPAPRA
jgi:hypothetical protein